MSRVREIIQHMPERYVPGGEPVTYYFSIGPDKWTVKLTAERCEIIEGRQGDADCVLKCTPELFERMVLKGKAPGPLDIARGRIKTNDPARLAALRDRFRMD